MTLEKESVVMVPLEYLALAPENSRTPDLEAVEGLKASIREAGLLQNLVGYEAGERVLIVAGGHRLLALQALAREGHPVGEVPVRLVPREKALLLSVAENLARRDLSPLEEAEVVARLLEAGIPEEMAARELGRSPAFIRDRALVARGLSPSWRPLLAKGEIPFALAVELARLPEGEQEGLLKQWGKDLRPETVRALRLKDAVPTSRLLPGVRERYLAQGGVLEADLAGEERATDRPLALRLQQEAAQALAERLSAVFALDLPWWRLIPGEGTVVVLNTSTLEAQVFTGVQIRQGVAPSEEAGKETPGEAQAPREKAQAPKPLTGQAALEREALKVRAVREKALADPRYRMAALVLSVLATQGKAPWTRPAFRSVEARDFHPRGFPPAKNAERFRVLSGEKALLERLEALLGGDKGPERRVEDLLALPDETLEEAFRTAVALLLALPHGELPAPTLGMADQEHLMAYREEVLDQALAEVGRPGGKGKREKVEKLLREGNRPFPKALLEAR